MLTISKLLIKDIWNKFNIKATLLVVLMIFNGLTDGLVLAMLLPLLNMLLKNGDQQTGTIVSFVGRIFSAVGLPLNLLFMIGVIISLALIQNLIFLLQSWLAARLQHFYSSTWRQLLFSSYMKASWPFFVGNRLGDLANSLIGECDRVGGSFYLAFQIISASIVTLVYIGLSMAISWQITSALMLGGLILFFLVKGLLKQGYSIGKQISRLGDELHSKVNEFISGAKIIKATSTEELARTRFGEVTSDLRTLYFWSSFNPNILKALFEFSAIAMLCLLLYLGTQFLKINAVNILVITAVFVKLVPRLFSLQQNIQLFGLYIPGLETTTHMLEFAEGFEENLDDEAADRPLFKQGVDVTIKNLSFSYGDNEVLSNVNLKIPQGKMIGIVGGSGAGKSTLVDCILRLVDISPDSITVNQTSLHDLPLRAWRRSTGYVPQETFLFHDSIGHNILWGAGHLKLDDMINAAKMANIHEFVSGLPNGYDTVVGDRGVRLSGGQKQRIGLARALVNSPFLLILDEATSALDSESEQYVLEAIDELHGKMSIVMIAHRLSTVKNADYIYVLEEGRVVEEGSWGELIALNERFKHLWDLQNKDNS
ncbi:MAG: ABC transporter ATP-binding protein [Candidatus Saccharibacteria bacterium]